MPLFTTAPNSLCFLRLSAIGDICHAVAAIQAVQKHWPNTRITWIVGKVEAQLLEGIDNIELVVFDKKQGLSAMKQVWHQLKEQRFDALIHMQLALRASLLTLGIKATYRVGFNMQRAKEGQWLFTNRKITDTQSHHVLDSFFSFIEYLGVPRSTPTWNLPLTHDDHSFARQQLKEKNSVVISPAASKDERNWLPERYAQVADYIIEQGYQVVLCGSPTEREKQLSEQIIQAMQHNPINLVGKTTLKQLTAVLQQAKVVIAPDSGPAHLATTQHTAVLGLYGHSNPQRTGPYNNIDDVVSVYDKFVQQQHGKPASELPWSTRVKGSQVMHSITTEQVILAFNQIIGKLENVTDK